MGVRLNALGGTDWGEERLKPVTDLVPTLNAIVTEHRDMGVNIAQNTYEILKASGSIDNENLVFADRFTSVNGVKNTVQSYTTGAAYGNNKYTAGALSLFKFNNNVTDSLGNYTLTNTNVTFTTDKNSVANQASNFNGTNAYLLNTNSVFSGQYSKKFSMSFWIYHTNTTGTQTYYCNNTGITKLQQTAGALTAYVNNTLMGSFSPSLPTLSASTWYHIVVVYDGYLSSNRFKIYINNVVYNSTTLDAATGFNNTFGGGASNMYFGASNTPSNYYNGKMDELFVFHKSLSSTDVSNLYTNYDSYSFDYCSDSSIVIIPNIQSGNKSFLSNFCKHGGLLSSNNGDGNNDTETTGFTFTSAGAQTSKYGVQIIPKYASVLKSVTKHASSTATKCYLYLGKTFSSAKLIEGPITYSGNTATFSKNIVLDVDKVYWIVNDANGSSYTAYQYLNASLDIDYTYLGVNVYFSKGLLAGSESTTAFGEIISFVTQNVSGALTTITNITLDISDGVTTISSQPINKSTNISSLIGGKLILTYNLTTTDNTITPEIFGYGGMIK